VTTGEPLVIRRGRTIEGHPWPYEALWLPLSDNDSEVTMLLAAMVYDEASRRTPR